MIRISGTFYRYVVLLLVVSVLSSSTPPVLAAEFPSKSAAAADGVNKKKKRNAKRATKPRPSPIVAEVVPRCDLERGRIDINVYSVSAPLVTQNGVLDNGVIKPLDKSDQFALQFSDPRDLKIALAMRDIFQPKALGLYAPYSKTRQGKSAMVSTIALQVDPGSLRTHQVYDAYLAIRKHNGNKVTTILISECSELAEAEAAAK
jgi:hypothetical protein